MRPGIKEGQPDRKSNDRTEGTQAGWKGQRQNRKNTAGWKEQRQKERRQDRKNKK